MGTSHTQVVCVWYTCTGTAGQTSQVQWSFETSSGYTPFDPHMSATIEAVCHYFVEKNDCLSFYDYSTGGTGNIMMFPRETNARTCLNLQLSH